MKKKAKDQGSKAGAAKKKGVNIDVAKREM
jgi:hypothetical protein